MKRQRGFTLIELLMIIAIISLLSTIVISGIKPSGPKARNIERTKEIQEITKAFYLGPGDSLPQTGDGTPLTGEIWVCVSASCAAGIPTNLTINDYLLNSLPSLHLDPPIGGRYSYGYLYMNPWNSIHGFQSPQDQYIFTRGAYLLWLQEMPLSINTCAPGHLFLSIPPSTAYCLYQIQ